MNNFRLTFLLLIIISFFQCGNDTINSHPIATAAMIIWAGEPAVDGCGWLIKIGDTNYHIDSLPVQFQKDSLLVNVGYENDTNNWYCGLGAIPIPVIKILSIETYNENCAPITINAAPYKNYPNDIVSIEDAYIKGDCLKLKVEYSGGCKIHLFRLIYTVPKCGTPPQPPLTLSLSHDNNGDACKALITQDISFNLSSLKNADSSSVSFYFEAQGYSKRMKYKY